jgi:protein SCO1/2
MTQAPARGQGRIALLALYVILLTTVSWWALALWPAPEAPAWLARTRALCFGSTPDGLPDAGGWILLVGQPLGMIAVLLVVWGSEVGSALAALGRQLAGRVLLASTAVVLLTGATLAASRVRTADVGSEAFDPVGGGAVLTRINDPAPALALIDQQGDTLSLGEFQGRPVLVTFAYAHCQTVCPVVVHEALEAQRATATQHTAVVIVTLDPWRDTPARLPSIADGWGLGDDAYVLSGDIEAVERVLSRWRIPRVRNEASGDLSHPAIVYVVSPAGRLSYALPGGVAALTEAIRSL